MKKFKLLTTVLCSFFVLSTTFVGCANKANSSSKTLNVFNNGDYIQEDLIKKFEKETGIKVNYTTYDSNEIMYQKVKNSPGTYDVIFPSDYMVEKMTKEDMLEKIDFNNVSNYKNIDDKFKSLSYDPNNEYSVPYMWGTIGILYNSDKVKEDITSWSDLWNEKYKNNILMFDSIRDTMGIGLKKLGYSLNSTDSSQVDKAAQDLAKQKPLVQSYVMDEVKDKMVAGEADIATVYSGDAVYIKNQAKDKNFKYVVPKEGSNKWFDTMVIPKGSKNKTEAEKFIDFLCDAQNAKDNVDYIGYSTPNKAAFEMLDEDVKNDKTAYPDDTTLKNCEVFKDLGDNIKLYDDAWLKVKSN